ncbi:MAG TPA: CDP-alcohol phosphatidyltransferase family protein [Longimicrobiaceae bacterium]|nr:CDP-alcohol phosphatidyltransferase family protein [Longimicrobiaceae bacterium]
MTERRGEPALRVVAAWGVHLYTATGLVLAALVAVLIVRGGDESFRLAFLLMVAATFVDATDGSLARAVDVHRVLPSFDGRRLDDIIDFHTYVTLPLLLVWRAGVLPAEHAPWLLLPLLASAYGFSQAEAKTADGYFQGFPSYWNVVAFYLYHLRPPAWLALGTIVVLSLLTFVPSKYLHSSQPGRLNRWTRVFTAVWGIVLLLVLLEVPRDPRAWVWASLLFPLYYMLVSWIITLRDWRTLRRLR